MEINGNQLTIYIDGQPVEASDGSKLIISNDQVTSRTSKEYSEAGQWEYLKMTWYEGWNYNFWRSKELPRKQKKSYRKRLIKMLIQRMNRNKKALE